VKKRKIPIQMSEAGPHPWRIAESKGGHLYIYAEGEHNPIELVRTRKRMTRRELAQLQLICDAVNYFRRHHPQFIPKGGC
jgi:hypothetical protein